MSLLVLFKKVNAKCGYFENFYNARFFSINFNSSFIAPAKSNVAEQQMRAT